MKFLELIKEGKEEKPSKGLSKKQKSDVVKKAKAGKDIGKKGKGFEKIADKAAKKYGSKEAGQRVAASAMWKNMQREGAGMDHEVSMAVNSLKSIMQSVSILMEKLGGQERNIPGWIQDHITNAENYIDQAAQGFHEIEGEDLDEKTEDIVKEAGGQKIPGTITLYDPQLKYLKEKGVKESTNGRELFFPISLVQELRNDARVSEFKKGFIDTYPDRDDYIASHVLSRIKDKLEKEVREIKVNGVVKYRAIQGDLTRNGTFRFDTRKK